MGFLMPIFNFTRTQTDLFIAGERNVKIDSVHELVKIILIPRRDILNDLMLFCIRKY